jgi:hypothetical protein
MPALKGNNSCKTYNVRIKKNRKCAVQMVYCKEVNIIKTKLYILNSDNSFPAFQLILFLTPLSTIFQLYHGVQIYW